MRKVSLIIALPLLATISACSGTKDAAEESAATETVDVKQDMEAAEASDAAAVTAEKAAGNAKEEARSGGAVFTKAAAVSPSVAPGVAFQYQYDFRVPGDKIEAVQDEHAAACETLGLSRCQITGLSFNQSERGYPEGRMQFLLDPQIARKFGRDAISSVEKAEGVLAKSNVEGENVGAEIASSQVRSAGVEAEVKRIEARLAGKGLANDERTELRRRAEELRDMLGNEKQNRRTGEARIATTPMAFNYSGNMGIGGSDTFGDAWSASSNSMTTMLSVLLMLFGVILPWLLPFAMIVLLVKSPLGAGLRRWWRGNSPLVDEPVKE
jgi:Domain of unknown function (DUF4349)